MARGFNRRVLVCALALGAARLAGYGQTGSVTIVPSLPDTSYSNVVAAGTAFSVQASFGTMPRPFQVRWFKNGGEIAPPVASTNSSVVTFSRPAATEQDSGIYWAQATHPVRGTMQSMPRPVVVVPAAAGTTASPAAPEIVAPLTDRTLMVGEAACLVAGVRGERAGLRFQWFKDDVALPGEIEADLVFPSVRLEDAGSYRMEVINDFGSARTSAAVQVNASQLPPRAPVIGPIRFISSVRSTFPYRTPDDPLISYGGVSAGAMEGTSATIFVRLGGEPAPTIQWFRDGDPIPGATAPAFVIERVEYADRGVFSVTVTNSHGRVESLVARLDVGILPGPPKLAQSLPARVSLATGESLTVPFEVLTPTVLSNLRWLLPSGEARAVSSSDVIALTDVSPSAAGIHTLTATNSAGTFSTQMLVEVRLPPIAMMYYGSTTEGASALLFREDGTGVELYTSLEDATSIATVIDPDGEYRRAGAARASEVLRVTRATAALDGMRLTLPGFPSIPPFTRVRTSEEGPLADRAGYYSGSYASGPNGSAHVMLTPAGDTVVALLPRGSPGYFTGSGRMTRAGRSVIWCTAGANTMPGQLELEFDAAGQLRIRDLLGVERVRLARSDAMPVSRLANLSTRGVAGTGDTAMIAGFTYSAAPTHPTLMRGVGPTLRSFGLSAALPAVALKLFRGQTLMTENSGWDAGLGSADIGTLTSATASVGAFALPVASRDAALLRTLNAGGFTLQVSSAGTAPSGVALAEIYDANMSAVIPGAPRLINVSSRGFVSHGEQVLIAGFVVTGNAPRRLLIRGVGPGLGEFGLSGFLRDPVLEVFRGDALCARSDDWADPTVVEAARRVGAFPLRAASADGALLLIAPPGVYSAKVRGKDRASGLALIEVYEVP